MGSHTELEGRKYLTELRFANAGNDGANVPFPEPEQMPERILGVVFPAVLQHLVGELYDGASPYPGAQDNGQQLSVCQFLGSLAEQFLARAFLNGKQLDRY
jgi:hypothetical protein